MKIQLQIFLIVPLFFQMGLTAQPISNTRSTEYRLKLAAEMEHSMNAELLDKWYPACVDTAFGGFLSTFRYDFTPAEKQDKFLVTQARHTWTTAKASELYPQKEYYLQCAHHGYLFLKNVMWDDVNGGFFNLLDRQGNVISNTKAPKEAYGNAFGIYALAAYYHASKDTGALSLAKKAFWWMEKHSHDPIHKGYFQHLANDGTPIKRTTDVPSTSDLGYKDQNSSIHLLEAMTELYQVWPDPLVRERLLELLVLVRDKITNAKGDLVLFFQPDWTPVSFRDSTEAVIMRHKGLDHVSFGHDIETAYLMLEASHALGLKNDKKTLSVGKRMTDHALASGWDETVGGFYDEGYYFKKIPGITIINDSKNWWAQAEAMNTLLLMAELYPNDPLDYYSKFLKQWNYINTYLIDHQYGGWYDAGLDKSPERRTALKGQIWKGAYHDFRSLSNCIERLKKMQ